MIRNALYIQSGGPTAVINASAYGVIEECRCHRNEISTLYAARYGTIGVLNDELIDTAFLGQKDLALFTQTPSMIFGSCRYHMMDFQVDERDYRRYYEVLKKHDIGYLFLNGGNGTLASSIKIEQYLKRRQYDCKVMVIPKTVDNDIEGIDHSPGYPSSARHVIVTVSELAHDIRCYDTGIITVVEVMGRDTGWLAAASLAACENGNGPDLIYVPEVEFDLTRFLQDVREVIKRQKKCLIVVAEGVKNRQGRYMFEQLSQSAGDPALNMGGVAICLASFLRQHFDCKVRGVDLGLMQRCGAHTAVPMDVQEAIALSRRAVQEALKGVSAKMVSAVRQNKTSADFVETLVDLELAQQGGHPLPKRFIAENGSFIQREFLEYLLPLVGTLPQYASRCW